jgi:hypothetical protein
MVWCGRCQRYGPVWVSLAYCDSGDGSWFRLLCRVCGNCVAHRWNLKGPDKWPVVAGPTVPAVKEAIKPQQLGLFGEEVA